MAKDRKLVALTNQQVTRLAKLLGVNAGEKSTRAGQSKNRVTARGWFDAIIVDSGPDGEDDYSDNRYWVKRARGANAILDNATVATDRLELEAVLDEDDLPELWVTASHKGESSEQSHELATDGTQQVTIQWTYDALNDSGTGGQIRFFFWVRTSVTPFPIGGQFLAVGTKPATNFVCDNADGTAWDFSYQSDPYDNGNVLYDFAVFGGSLYACGLFEPGGSGGNKRLIRWNGTDWVEVAGHGFDQIYCMLSFGGSLYLGGTRTGGIGENVRTYNGSVFADATGGTCLGLSVRYLYDWNGTLVACGESSLGDGFHGIATLGGGAWSSLGTGLFLTGGVNPGTAWGCCDYNGDLAVVGRFSAAGGTITAENVAVWDGSWNDIGDIGTSSTIVYAACIFNSELYAGGTATHIYKHDGSTTFSTVGEEIITFLDPGIATVRTLCVSADGESLIVAGLFHKRDSADYGGPLPEMCVVKFDGTDYSHYYGGIGSNYAITSGAAGSSGVVYRCRLLTLPGAAGDVACFSGSFNRASNVYSPLLARLTAAGWRSCGQGLRVSGFDLPAWQASHDYLKTDRIIPTTPNGYSYQPRNDGLAQEFAGTSGATEPVWSTTLGGETVDGGVIWITRDDSYPTSPSGAEGFIWVCLRYAGGVVAAGVFAGFVNSPGRGTLEYGVSTNVVFYKSDAFSQMGSREGTQYGGCMFNGRPVLCGDTATSPVATWIEASTWAANTAYVVNQTVIPTSPNGFQYRCIVAGTSHATTEPVWPTNPGDAIGDGAGALEWECEDISWVGIGVNIDTGGEHRALANFDSKLWLGGQSITISATGYDFATSSGAIGTAGNWTGANITGALSVRKWLIANIDATVDKIYAACFSIAGVDGCVYVCSAGSTTFAEVGGGGNRVSGEANSISAWVDADGEIAIVVCGGLDVNGTPCSVAEYRAATWSIIAGVLDLAGQALALGTWARQRNAVLMGGDYAIVESVAAMNLSAYDADGWDLLARDVGGASAGVTTIGLKTDAG